MKPRISGAIRAAAGVPSPAQITRIEPLSGWRSLPVAELLAYRELVFFLVWRDIKVRYKQMTLGIGWAVLQPVSMMVVFSMFFGRLAGMPSDGVPYPLFTLAALVPWTLFDYALAHGASSVLHSQELITKVYFPRLAIPVATVLSGVFDFMAAFVVLLGVMLWYDVEPTIRLAWIPAFVTLALVISLGLALWLSAAMVKYRDVRYVVPFLSRLWLFATPIAYPSSLLDPSWRIAYAMNPMVGVVEGFRWALLGVGTHPGSMLAASSVVALLVLETGAFYFRRVEVTFADVI
jgi:lipopolysaccharide transport system permease protein